MRKIDSTHGRAAVKIVEHLAGHFPADPVLRLFGRSADVRREDDVLQALQGAFEALRIGRRLRGKNIERCSRQMPLAKDPRQGVEVDDRAATVIDQVGAALHQAEFSFSDHAMRGRRFRNMKADNVAVSQQTLKAFDRFGIAVAKPVGVIVIDDLHAHPFGKGRELRSDIAVSDNSERPAPHLVAVGRGFVPAAPVSLRGARENSPKQHDDFSDHQLRDAAGVGEGSVEDRNAALARRIEVDLVGSDAEAPHGDQAIGAGESFVSKLRSGPNAQKVDAPDRLKQPVRIEGLRQAFDI